MFPSTLPLWRHFEDGKGRELLAQVYLIEPEAARAKVRRNAVGSSYLTVNGLQTMADEHGIGGLYRQLRDGVRGIFSAQGYSQTVGYVRRLGNGGVRTLMLVGAIPGDDDGGVEFTIHATRFERYLGVSIDELRASLPESTVDSDVRGWNGSSPEERLSAQGLRGLFHSGEEMKEFLDGLRAWAE